MSEQKRVELREKIKELRTLVKGRKAEEVCADMERLVEELQFTVTIAGSIPPKPWIAFGTSPAEGRAVCVFLAANPGIAKSTAEKLLKLGDYVRDVSIKEIRDAVIIKRSDLD